MADQVEVFPLKNGHWRYRDGEKQSESIETRGEAITAAREAAGVGVREVFDGDGKSLGTVKSTGRRVVLLRLDGSVHGELDAPSTGSGAQLVNIAPASEKSEAGSVN